MDPVSDLFAAVRVAAALVRGAELAQAPTLERPPRPEMGDYSTNAAMLLAPTLGEPPRDIAERLGEALSASLGHALERAEVAGPGFLNLHMADRWYLDSLGSSLEAGDAWGAGRPSRPERVLVEFVSANPTGPITVAAGRHAAYGDALCRILAFAGHAVEREYYVNDHGSQVRLFGESIRARAQGEEPPEGAYHGTYVTELAGRIAGAGSADPAELARRGVAATLEEVEATLERFRVQMDRFFSERTLHEEEAIARSLDLLEKRDHVYRYEDAVWLRSTTFGDDKDRVLARSSGELTYFAADIAYHADKFARGYDRAIDVLGADHHGYVPRMRAAWQALGGDPERIEFLIMQLVNLLEGGERMQMSKRDGEFVTLDDLVYDIGVDAARWFLLQRSHETTLDLDLALARSQSQDNPVYYVQYAHARMASILRRAGEQRLDEAGPVSDEPLHPSARLLVKRLLELPAEVEEAAARRAPHRLTVYAHETAQDFSAFYRDCKVLDTPNEPFRLALCVQAKQVIARCLDLLGIEAPEEM
ncbi:MAG: arginine--tRNA ligase [Actinomycetota bacterium]|nr:arginine--tRNA ligase [Actinomycetota bacterium]